MCRWNVFPSWRYNLYSLRGWKIFRSRRRTMYLMLSRYIFLRTWCGNLYPLRCRTLFCCWRSLVYPLRYWILYH